MKVQEKKVLNINRIRCGLNLILFEYYSFSLPSIVMVQSCVEALSSAIEKHFLKPQRLVTKTQASVQRSERVSMPTCAEKYRELLHHCVAKIN